MEKGYSYNTNKLLYFATFILLLSIAIFVKGLIKKQSIKPINKLTPTLKVEKELIFNISYYNPTKNQCGIDSTMTASMERIKLDKISISRWVALSQNLFDSLNLKIGDTIDILSPFCYNGKWKIKDKIGREPDIKNKKGKIIKRGKLIKNRIDILLPVGQISYMMKGKILFIK
jgi:hypothetical protein